MDLSLSGAIINENFRGSYKKNAIYVLTFLIKNKFIINYNI